MAQAPSFQEPTGNSPKTYLLIALAVAAFLALGWYIYTSWNSVPGVTVEEAPPTAIDMLPPPPPPPPPPEPLEKPPEPQDNPSPTPEPTPSPSPDKPAPAPMQIDGPAQAGTDAYGVGAGAGGGTGSPNSTGTCIGANCGGAPKTVQGVDRFWGRGVASALEDHIERSKKVNVDAYLAEFNIWVSPSGELTRVQMINGSGNGKVDQTVLALLQTARGLKPPPDSIRMPQKIKVGRKRF